MKISGRHQLCNELKLALFKLFFIDNMLVTFLHDCISCSVKFIMQRMLYIDDCV